MKVNKVVIDGEVKLDLSTDTVSEFDVMDGVSFHKPNGERSEGSLMPQTLHVATCGPKEYTPPEGAYFSEVTVEILPDTFFAKLCADELTVITEEDLAGVEVLRSSAIAWVHLTELHLPKSIVRIEDTPFRGSYINQIFYPGTLAELQALFDSDGQYGWLYPMGNEHYDSNGYYICSDGTQQYGVYNTGGEE